jgi:hypothetical protein
MPVQRRIPCGRGRVLLNARIAWCQRYFSAHWCPPCRNFTPKFARWYDKNQHGSGPDMSSLEVVFVSSDRSEEAYREYLNEMPWKALPWTQELQDMKMSLGTRFKVFLCSPVSAVTLCAAVRNHLLQVSGIPTCVVLSPSGAMITSSAVERILEELEGTASRHDVVRASFYVGLRSRSRGSCLCSGSASRLLTPLVQVRSRLYPPSSLGSPTSRLPCSARVLSCRRMVCAASLSGPPDEG